MATKSELEQAVVKLSVALSEALQERDDARQLLTCMFNAGGNLKRASEAVAKGASTAVMPEGVLSEWLHAAREWREASESSVTTVVPLPKSRTAPHYGPED